MSDNGVHIWYILVLLRGEAKLIMIIALNSQKFSLPFLQLLALIFYMHFIVGISVRETVTMKNIFLL